MLLHSHSHSLFVDLSFFERLSIYPQADQIGKLEEMIYAKVPPLAVPLWSTIEAGEALSETLLVENNRWACWV